MVHLRIVVPGDRSAEVLELLDREPAVCNVVHLQGVARGPTGDLVLCDVPREDASVILSELRDLGIERDGSISVEKIDVQLSERMERAVELAEGAPSDAVVWEEVTSQTSENAELTGSFLVFLVLAALIASVGIYLDSAILIVGAMVVGPEFGPLAGFCVAAVERRPRLAVRSFLALVVGFPIAIAAVVVASLIFRATGITPDAFDERSHGLARVIANPDVFAFFVAFCAGAAGMLSLSTAKSGALIGVLISVTTIPAAANIGVSAAYRDWHSLRGSLLQLAVNLAAILVAGTLTLAIQRMLYARRKRRHGSPRGSGPGTGRGARRR